MDDLMLVEASDKFGQTLEFERLPMRDGTEWQGSPTRCFYRVVGYRAVKAGEWYVSGATPMAYRAGRDLRSEFWIVKPLRYAATRRLLSGANVTVPGERVAL